MKSKTAAMEMSVGTIVTIVLLVTVLILGVVLIKNIFSSAKGVVDLTDQQLRDEVNKLFSEENKISIYPGTKFIEIKQTVTDGVGLGIKNLLTGASGSKTFSYLVKVSDPDLQEKCGVNKETVEDWITIGRAADEIPLASGDSTVRKVLFSIPLGAPLCTIQFQVDVSAGGGPYATDTFAIEIKAK